MKTSNQFESIYMMFASADEIKNFIEVCGRNAKEFDWTFIENLTSLDVIEVLNLMPKLETISIHNGYAIKLIETEDFLNKQSKINLSLPKLHRLEISSTNLFEFFAKFLPKNQIVELSFDLRWVYIDDLSPLRALYAAQKDSIKRVSFTNVAGALEPLEILTLDELSVNDLLEDSDDKIFFKLQPQLKILNIGGYDDEIVERLHDFENLENLTLGNCLTFTDFNSILKVKKLKKFKVYEPLKNFSYGDLRWISNVYENLEELDLPFYDWIIHAEVLESFPNLKVLNVRTSLKLNSFAKLSKLENLNLNYESKRDIELFEVDTGTQIVHQNLKVLKLNGDVKNFWRAAANVSELYELFPNLEKFHLHVDKNKYEWSDEQPGQNYMKFFESFNKFKNLKMMSIKTIPIRHCKESFEKIAEELKKLKQKIHFIYFEDRIELKDYSENLSYQKLIDGIEDDFQVLLYGAPEVRANDFYEYEGSNPYVNVNDGRDRRDHMTLGLQILATEMDDNLRSS